MKEVHRIIAVAVVLCMAMANIGVLHAAHLRQHGDHSGRGQHRGNAHDPHKCAVCIHVTSAKTLSLDSEGPLGLSPTEIEEPLSFHGIVLRSVSLSSLAPRAPPHVS